MKEILIGIIIALFLATSTIAVASGDIVFYLNDKEGRIGSSVSITENELERGMMVFLMPADKELNTVQISLDNGRVWNVMDKDGDDFIFRYRPIADSDMDVIFMAIGQRGKVLGKSPIIKVSYRNN